MIVSLLMLSLTSLVYSQTETFNSGIPATWAINSNQVVANNWVHTATGGLQSTGAATVNPAANNTVGTTAEYYLITPQIITPSNAEVRFFTKQGNFSNRGTIYQLRVSLSNQPDITSFNVVLKQWTETELNVAATTYEEKIVDVSGIPAGVPVYFAFVAVTNQTGVTSTAGDSWFVDNVRVITTCAQVTAVTTVVGPDNAVINWTHPTATNFAIEVVPIGAGHGTVGTPVTGTTYTATGLTDNTSYDVYIRTVCDADTSSGWAGPFTFRTSFLGLNCASPIIVPSDVITSPYTLSANLAQYYDSETYTSYNSIGLSCVPPNASTQNQLLGNHVFLSFTPSTTGLVNIRQAITVASGGGGNNCYNSSSSVFIFDSCTGVGTSASCLGAMTTESNQQTNNISNFYVVAGQTYIFVISSPYQRSNPGAGICFTFTISGSTCPAPATLTIDSLQQTSAVASWNNVQNLVSSWEYVAMPFSAGAPIGSTVLTSTNTNVGNTISGLTAGTQYNLYVRSVCGGIPGPWSTPRAFTTPCNPFPLPYYTGFNDSTLECWSQQNLNNDLQFFAFGNSAFSEPVARCRTQNSNDMLISPQFNFDGVTQKRLRFKFNNYGNWGLIVNNPVGGKCSFEVRISTTGVGPNNFTTVLIPLAQYTTAYNYVEIIVPIPNTIVGDVSIAWVLPEGALQEGNWFYLDDVYIEDLPACSEPQYPVITPGSITSTSAEVSWTNGYNNTQWEIIAQPFGSPAPTASTPGQLVNTNPYTLTGLIPSTRYEFYVRAYCSSTLQSQWIGPTRFITSCIAQFSPYYESFNDSDVNSKKFCWTTRNVAGDVAQWRISATEASIQPQGAFMNPFASFDDWLISVPINVVGLKRLRFQYRAATSLFYPSPRGNFEVLMSPTPDFATYTTLIPSHDFTNGAYQEDSVLFTGTGTFYIAFRVPPTMTDPANSGVVMIDDVVIDDAPPCPDPNLANLDVSGITTTTANLSWTAGYTETQWQVVIQSPGSGVPTGSGTTVNITPAYSAVGLSPDTLYEYYVKAVCSATESSNWVGPFRFKTTCIALPTPFTETFDSNSTTESCWAIENGNADGSEWFLNQTANPIFGDQMAAMMTGSNGNNNDWLISPTLMARPNQRLRFYYKTYSSFFEEDLKVRLSTTGAAIDQFSTILYENSLNLYTDANGVVTGSNTVTLPSPQDVRVGDFIYIPGFPFPYPTYVAAVQGSLITLTNNATITQTGVQNIQFSHEVINNPIAREMVINLTDITVPTNINLAFQTPFFPSNPWNYRGQYTFIDNVIVEDIPACPSVINVTTTNVIDTTADINWEVVGSETSWEISVQPSGTPAPVGATLPEYLVTTTTHPKTITGLIPSTQYQYYIRAICSGSSQSEWVGPFTFTTKCDYSNVCQYKMTVTNGSTGHVYESVEVRQNGVIVQNLIFPYTGANQPTSIDYDVFLCRGVEYSLYYNAGGGSGAQYTQAQVVIRDELNNIVWTSPLGLGTPYTNIFTAVANCGVVTCPQPTNVAVNNLGTFTWTPGGSETQWEVFVQPVTNGTIPQSGTIINSPTYTPTAADFVNPTGGTFEFFVRAICSANDKSFWTGPKVFIRNDESSTAIRLPVNTGTTCDVSGINASFIGATVSPNPTTCTGNNSGDIWYDFIATSKVHTIEIGNLAPGTYYASSYQGAWPKIMMALYEVQPDGSLLQKGCSENNSMVTMYSSELVVGKTYKIRFTLDDPVATNKTFSICITTPNACDMNAFNYDFEKLPMQSVTGISTIINARVVPGWRVNTVSGTMFFQEATNSGNVTPYSGGQCIQLIQDGAAAWDPNDPNIKGLYRDFDTSEIPQMSYSFASATRTNGSTLQLYAGPPSGPFTLVVENFSNTLVWQLIEGNYIVPSGQTTTRFIFRVKENAVGHVLDAANFIPNTDINIATANTTLNCTTTSMNFDANGVGMWEAEPTNPAVTTIASPNTGATAVSGFTAPGNYVFHWKTRYCDKTITITKQGNAETPIVVNPTVYCLNATASPLTATVATGNTLLWYTSATGGTGTTIAPTPNTSVAGSTQVYYVSSVDGVGCEGSRAQIVVQVNDLPTATISGTTTICSGTTAVITFNGTPNATVTYTVDGGSNQTIILDASGSATVTTSVLTLNSNYTLVSVSSAGTPTCSQLLTGNALITVNALPSATISGTTSICSGSTAVITFNGTPNATVTYTVDGGVNQTITLNAAGTASITTPALTTNSTYALVSVSSTALPICSQLQTGAAIVTVNALPVATISGTTSICSGATAVITFNGTPNATVTYTVDGGSNQTITLDATGAATITTPALSSNSTYTLVSVTSGTSTCSQAQTGSAIITVGSLPTATILGNSTVCLNAASPVVTFIGANGASPYTFTYNVNGGANQTITTTTGNNVSISVPTSAVGVFTYNLVNVSSAGLTSCSQAQTGSAVVTVNGLPTATISGTTTICSGGTAVITFTGTANATVTYTVDGGVSQTIVLDATGSATLTTPTLTANSTYALVSVTSAGTPVCSQSQTGSAVVTVNALPIASISGTTTICSGTTAVITFNGTPNATVTYTVDGGTNQTIVLDASGLATVTTPSLTANSTYTLVNVSSTGLPICSQTQIGTAVVTVNTLPTATISGTTAICSGATAVITFNGTPNATVTYTVDGGTNQTITLDNTGFATLTTPVITNTTTYALVSVTSGATSCSQTLTGTAVVTVNALPTATISGTTSICTGTTALVSFNGTPNAIVTYTVDGGSNQTITLNATGTASITTPVLSTSSTYSLVSVVSGTTTCSQTQTGSAIITVNPLTTPNVTFSYAQTCINAAVNPLPVLTPNFVTGGVYSSSTVTVNPTTGAVNLATATVATHVITYTLAANTTTCTAAATSTANLVITSGVNPVTGFSYDSNYCATSANALPSTSAGFTTGGTFTATPTGLVINSTTGEINISGSLPGTYTVVYSIAADGSTCTIAGSSNSILTISSKPVVVIDDSCQNQQLVLDAQPVNGSFNPNNVTYSWSVSNTPVFGSNASTFNVSDYLEQNPSVTLPVTFSVSVSVDGCEGFDDFEVAYNPCKIIPKGISPNDDGFNDTFDLTGYGVKEITIFNRYGTTVFYYNGTYTNQWKGQSDQGDELPDGTYFYSIHTVDGASKTGWVYINREY
ncbi:choice-of-anchor J domain-containing protein [Flavobacterium sp. RSB2_4_14]|uniref:choice-of-anchor J domain-containing protein n=1 Tax=Flavobacterium sp. RSB2_4_14 TaxID=3447665 RepID=UPI003F33C23B